jgi:hypothetical protein
MFDTSVYLGKWSKKLNGLLAGDMQLKTDTSTDQALDVPMWMEDARESHQRHS